MRIARHGIAGAERPIASGADGNWRDLSSIARDIDAHFLENFSLTDFDLLELPTVDHVARFGPPISTIGKIVCVGLNYRAHAEETGADAPEEPVLFLKTPDTVIGANDDVHIPRGSVATDWEAELAVVIGRTARYLESPASARACIRGYAISHDVSERDFQLRRGGQWDKGKNCETFNPLGPWLVTPDEVDPQNLEIELSVNGAVRQSASTAQMIFDVDYLVWYVSQFLVLRPGDIINTGTPSGVAMGQPDTPYLRAADRVEIAIEGLGRQAQTFVDAPL